jgi:hypothetical protein
VCGGRVLGRFSVPSKLRVLGIARLRGRDGLSVSSMSLAMNVGVRAAAHVVVRMLARSRGFRSAVTVLVAVRVLHVRAPTNVVRQRMAKMAA